MSGLQISVKDPSQGSYCEAVLSTGARTKLLIRGVYRGRAKRHVIDMNRATVGQLAARINRKGWLRARVVEGSPL